MAIIANRAKTFSIIPDLLASTRALLIKSFSMILILSSLALWYGSSESRTSRTIFNTINSVFIEPIVTIFDVAIEDTKIFIESVNSLFNTRQENIALKLENARLNKLLFDASHIYAENQQLKNQLKFVDEEPFKQADRVSARVIGINNGSHKKMAIINLGTKNAANKNQVVVSDGAVIGRLVQVSDNYSTLMLISDSQSRIPVVSAVSGLRGIFAGDGHKAGMLMYIPEGGEVKVGETLFTSGDGKYYPSGIPVAKIVSKNDGQVYAKPIVELGNIRFVTVLR